MEEVVEDVGDAEAKPVEQETNFKFRILPRLRRASQTPEVKVIIHSDNSYQEEEEHFL